MALVVWWWAQLRPGFRLLFWAGRQATRAGHARSSYKGGVSTFERSAAIGFTIFTLGGVFATI